jgi:hypothetical protein
VIQSIGPEADRTFGHRHHRTTPPQPSCLMTCTDAVDRCFFAAYYREALIAHTVVAAPGDAARSSTTRGSGMLIAPPDCAWIPAVWGWVQTTHGIWSRALKLSTQDTRSARKTPGR